MTPPDPHNEVSEKTLIDKNAFETAYGCQGGGNFNAHNARKFLQHYLTIVTRSKLQGV